jgi:CRP/FNR family transcriptional regulator
MLSVLSQRLKAFTVLIEDLSLREVPGRLAAYLLYVSERDKGTDDINLEISKTQLASILGTIPETLSRILARMTREEIIESDDKRHIRICNRTAVEELASGERRLA